MSALHGPPPVAFDFRGGEGPEPPVDWLAVAGRTVALTSGVFGGIRRMFVTLDANHVPGAAGDVLLQTPRMTLEPGNDYRVTMEFVNATGAELTRWDIGGATLLNLAAGQQTVVQTFVPSTSSTRIRLLANSLVATRPGIITVRVERALLGV